ncbi:hypothetical protein GOQ30_01060 [Flavobacterium sp. TP390]|uniref:Uncharacterized protein n=1 Tax=Flavobacterium profundi TaxID=1774945 RepID=A0A6I4IIP5_9FLAO|nr:STM3941 family protein [Flavobacterium profundi]MVO07749.1 hypothetical protein [Flavobacterium profundi]
MEERINFDKKRIILGILLAIVFLRLSVWFILEPERFMRNFLSSETKNVIFGIVASVFFLAGLYSIVMLLPRKCAIIICEEYIIDRSRYEAIGKIRWDEISKIQRLKKKSIQFFFKEEKRIQSPNDNLLKKFLRWAHNWEYKKSIIISSVFLECDIDTLEMKIKKAYRKSRYKKNKVLPKKPSPTQDLLNKT